LERWEYWGAVGGPAPQSANFPAARATELAPLISAQNA
jgi:hypothetical protein